MSADPINNNGGMMRVKRKTKTYESNSNSKVISF